VVSIKPVGDLDQLKPGDDKKLGDFVVYTVKK